MICGHCGRPMGDFLGGHAIVLDGVPVCHPNEPGRPDCYRLVTVYGHSLNCRTCRHYSKG